MKTGVTVVVVGTLLVAGCSSSGPKQPGDAGPDVVVGGGGIPLTATPTGFVMEPTSGVMGAWYAEGDGVGPGANTTTTDGDNSNCQKAGFLPSDCTQIMSPTPGQPFAPDQITGAMCTQGVAAKVLPNPTTQMDDYTDLWGGGIGLDFNNPGGDAGVKSTFDLSRYTGVGFVISGDQIPPGKMRVNFPFMGQHGNDSPYYKGATLDNSMLTNGQVVTIHWADVGGPAYLRSQTPMVTPPPFDATKVYSIQWQVFTNTSTPTPYSFCVNDLTLLTSN